jgi:hypothetical protein
MDLGEMWQRYSASFPGEWVSNEAVSFGSVVEEEEKSRVRYSNGGKDSGIASPQIEKFWGLYREYPRYLKNVEKRKKRKAKKVSGGWGANRWLTDKIIAG